MSNKFRNILLSLTITSSLMLLEAIFPFASMAGVPGSVLRSDSAFGVYMSHTLSKRFMQAEGLNDQEMFDWCSNHMTALGAHWTRYSLLAAWQFIEPTLGGGYNWSADGPNGRPDVILGAVYAPGNDIHAVINIQALSFGAGAPTRSPFTNPVEYAAFVKALAEREAAQITLEALRSANPSAQLIDFFATLGEAIAAAVDGGIIEAQALLFSGDLTLDKDAFITLKGGYNGDYSARTGGSAISGSLTIEKGVMSLDNIAIE